MLVNIGSILGTMLKLDLNFINGKSKGVEKVCMNMDEKNPSLPYRPYPI